MCEWQVPLQVRQSWLRRSVDARRSSPSKALTVARSQRCTSASAGRCSKSMGHRGWHECEAGTKKQEIVEEEAFADQAALQKEAEATRAHLGAAESLQSPQG